MRNKGIEEKDALKILNETDPYHRNINFILDSLIKEGGFAYIEKGEGRPIIILHGLMGGLSNFQGVFEHFRTF